MSETVYVYEAVKWGYEMCECDGRCFLSKEKALARVAELNRKASGRPEWELNEIELMDPYEARDR